MKGLISLIAAVFTFSVSHSQTMIADYPFTGGSSNDVSGNMLNAIPHGSFTTTAGAAGIPNSALVFNSQSYLTIPPTTKMNLTNWTIMAHIKFSSFYSGTCQGSMILEHGVQGNTFSNYYSMLCGDGQYDHDCYSFDPTHETPMALACGSYSPSNPSYFMDSNWHVIISTYDSFNVNTYVDGAMIASFSTPYNYYYSQFDSLQSYIGLGSDSVDGYPNFWNGALDRLMIWNGALKDTEITFYSNHYDSTYHAPTSVTNVTGGHNNYKLYPIPATSVLNLSVGNYSGAAQLVIYNIYGQTVYNQQQQLSSGTIVTIPVSGLSAGNYILEVTDNKSRTTQTFNKL